MRIALISQTASPGILIFRKDFVKYLVSQGHTVYAFALDYSELSLTEVKLLGAIPIKYSLKKAGVSPVRDLRDIFALSRQLKKLAPDVVFSFFVKPSIYGTIAAALAGVPRRIAMLEGLGYIHTLTPSGFSFKKRVLQWVHGLLCSVGYAFADKVLFLNDRDPIDLAKVSLLNPVKFQVLGPIGLNLSEYPYSPVDFSKPIRFIFIARLLVEKGIFEYINAAKEVKLIYPYSEFAILGGVDFENPAALSQHQLTHVIEEGVVIYPGHVSNVKDWIDSAHVFVLPSYREGFPRSTQEAMAIGRAVITTDVPGCIDTVLDGVNGYLVPPWEPKALANKMIYLIEHPEEIERMGRESHAIACERFDVNKVNVILANILVGK